MRINLAFLIFVGLPLAGQQQSTVTPQPSVAAPTLQKPTHEKELEQRISTLEIQARVSDSQNRLLRTHSTLQEALRIRDDLTQKLQAANTQIVQLTKDQDEIYGTTKILMGCSTDLDETLHCKPAAPASPPAVKQEPTPVKR